MSEDSSPQIPEPVRDFVALRALGLALPETGVQAAVDLMVAGFDSQALRVLAGADVADSIELDDLIAKVFDELSLHVTPVAAEDWLVRRICRRFLAGELTRREAESELSEFEFGFHDAPGSDALTRLFFATDPDGFRTGYDTPEEEFCAAFAAAAEAYLSGEASSAEDTPDEPASPVAEASRVEPTPNEHAGAGPVWDSRTIAASWRRHFPETRSRFRVLAWLALVAVWVAAGTATTVRWNGQPSWWESRAAGGSRLRCKVNLKQLYTLHISAVMESGAPDSGGGAPYIVSLFDRYVRVGHPRYERDLEVLHCPCSLDRAAPDSADTSLPARLRTTYVARDFGRFPIDPYDAEGEPLFADVPPDWNGVNIVYADGWTRFHSREELGYAIGEPIVFGPESRSELLRVLCVEPADE